MNKDEHDGAQPSETTLRVDRSYITGQSAIELDAEIGSELSGFDPDPTASTLDRPADQPSADLSLATSEVSELMANHNIQEEGNNDLDAHSFRPPEPVPPAALGVIDSGEDLQDSVASALKVDSATQANKEQSDLPALERTVATALKSALSGVAVGINNPDDGFDLEVPGARIQFKNSRATGATSSTINRMIPSFSNDEAASSRRKDSLDMQADAYAFAQIAASRGTAPPLAIGIFGPWGAGKSFFMDLVHDQISSLATRTEQQGPGSPSDTEFHSKVIQIRFNAWHYAETNLWASLVGNIFQELSSKIAPSAREEVLGRLNTARTLTIEASMALVQARKEQFVAREELESAKTSLTRAEAKPVRTASFFTDVMVSAFQDTHNNDIAQARTHLKDASLELGVVSAVTATEELTEEGAALLKNGAQVRDICCSIVKNVGSPWLATLYVFLAIAAPLVVVELTRWGLDMINLHRHWIVEVFVSATTFAAVLASWVRKASGPVLLAIQNLNQAKAKIDAHIRSNLFELQRQIEDNEADLAKASARVEVASDVLRATSARVAAVREELHGQSPASRLINFVRARASDGEYSKHLGLVSTIRRDFEELSNLVSRSGSSQSEANYTDRDNALNEQISSIISSAEAHNLLTEDEIQELKSIGKRANQTALPFERIVLFIDDVDRCPPQKVVEVLQAIHMLLAFKLFVVYVAVDVRWVGSSLAQQYRGMLKEPSGSDPLTSASDYLEKIFQIPYWVPSLTPPSCKSLLDAVLGVKEHGTVNNVTSLSATIQDALSNVSGSFLKSLATDTFVLATLSDQERELVQQFGAVLDSPRKAIRFANIVRLLKARELLGSSNNEIAVPLLAQLAIATATPDHYSQWRLILPTLSDRPINEVLNYMKHGYFSRHPVIRKTLECVQSHGLGHLPMSSLLERDQWAGRLSFAIPLNDVDGKLTAMVNSYVSKGDKDIPPFSEMQTKQLSVR